jgi:hypothetical protein
MNRILMEMHSIISVSVQLVALTNFLKTKTKAAVLNKYVFRACNKIQSKSEPATSNPVSFQAISREKTKNPNKRHCHQEASGSKPPDVAREKRHPDLATLKIQTVTCPTDNSSSSGHGIATSKQGTQRH